MKEWMGEEYKPTYARPVNSKGALGGMVLPRLYTQGNGEVQRGFSGHTNVTFLTTQITKDSIQVLPSLKNTKHYHTLAHPTVFKVLRSRMLLVWTEK